MLHLLGQRKREAVRTHYLELLCGTIAPSIHECATKYSIFRATVTPQTSAFLHKHVAAAVLSSRHLGDLRYALNTSVCTRTLPYTRTPVATKHGSQFYLMATTAL